MLSDIRHYILLMIYHFSPVLINFGRRTIFFFEEEDLRRWITLGIRAIWVLVLYGIHQDWKLVLLSYAVIHLVVFLLGKLLQILSERGLYNLESNVSSLLCDYELCKAKEFRTVSEEEGFGEFELKPGKIVAPMRVECEDMQIYPLENTDGLDAYNKRKADIEETGIAVNEKLASVTFKRKFGVYTAKEKLLNAMMFLTATIQVQMINAPELQKCKNIIISNGELTADIEPGPKHPPCLDAFSLKPFFFCCAERDIYYKERQKYERFVYNQMKTIDFIRGEV